MTDRERGGDLAPDEELPADEVDASGAEPSDDTQVIDTSDLAAPADEVDDEGEDEAEALEDTIVDAPATPAGRAAAAAAAAAATGRGPRRPAPPARTSVATQTPSDAAVHIDDRVSKWFVAGSVVVFVLILANGIFLGQGGLLTPSPTPPPSPIASPTPSVTPSPSGSTSPSPSGSTSPSPSVSTSPSASPSVSASPSASPSASASPSPSG